MAIPTAAPVNRSAKTRLRSSVPTQRSTRTVCAGRAAVIPAPKTNMPARKSTGVPATMRNAVAAAATTLATTATRAGSNRSASRPPIGALVAAPIGGRLADRFDPARVAVVAKVVAAAATAFLIVAGTPVLFLAGMFVFGAGITAAQPAQTVLVLRWVSSEDRRRVFALLFTGSAVGMAIGSFTAGYLVDLNAIDGMWPAFATAALGFLISAGLIGIAGRGAPVDEVPAPEDAPSGSA